MLDAEAFISGLATGSVSLAIAAWLMRQIIGHALKKDLEAFKSIELERVNAALATLNDNFAKQNIKLTWLHQQRGEKIAEIHSAIVNLKYLAKGIEDPARVQAMAEPLRVQTRDLSILFDKSRIYLPENIIGPLDDAIKSMVAFAKKHHELFSREFTIADFPTLRSRLEQVVDYDRKAKSTLELLEQEFRQALE